MPVTLEQVRAALLPDEPSYSRAVAQLGAGAIPHLDTLVQGSDVMLAAKAACLASMIQDSRAVGVLNKAATHSDPAVRVAAAGGARYIGQPSASDLLITLLNDHDAGVRKMALKSVTKDATPNLRVKVKAMRDNDPAPHIRELVKRVVGLFPR